MAEETMYMCPKVKKDECACGHCRLHTKTDNCDANVCEIKGRKIFGAACQEVTEAQKVLFRMVGKI